MEVKGPCFTEKELAEKSARLMQLDTQLSMDDAPSGRSSETLEADEKETLDDADRPSVLADLKQKSAEVLPDT